MTETATKPVFADAEEAYELLLAAVDLQAVVHNMLVAVPDLQEGNPSRFWRKMHEVRRAINRPERERLRQAYVRSLAAKGAITEGQRMDSEKSSMYHAVGETFRHVCDHPGLDCGGSPLRETS